MYLLILLAMMMNGPDPSPKNVLGQPLQACCFEPMTGYYRDGFCNTGAADYGVHTVCAVMTDDFLSYTSSCGNDLSTPRPEYGFPGLKPGDKWCLCVSRWAEAEKAGKAPKVYLPGCHENSLKVVTLELLQSYSAE